MKIAIRAIVVASLGMALTISAQADDFPSHPIKIIVPYAAGGPSDTGARLLLDPLGRALGQPVYIENRGGGGGLNGTEAFLKGDLDGYTLLSGGIAPLTIIPAMRKVSYVTDHDFVAIGMFWRSAQTLVVRSTLGVSSMAQFVAYAKAHPGKITVGSAGIGTVSHLAGELLQREAGIKTTHIPFRSTSESLPQLLGGQIDALVGDASTVAPQVRTGKIIALAVAAAQRTPALPDTPTMAEAGYPAVEAEGWHGLVASSKTPADRIARLREALRVAQSDPAYQKALAKLQATTGETGSDALAKTIRTDSAKWSQIIKSAGLSIN